MWVFIFPFEIAPNRIPPHFLFSPPKYVTPPLQQGTCTSTSPTSFLFCYRAAPPLFSDSFFICHHFPLFVYIFLITPFRPILPEHPSPHAPPPGAGIGQPGAAHPRRRPGVTALGFVPDRKASSSFRPVRFILSIFLTSSVFPLSFASFGAGSFLENR